MESYSNIIEQPLRCIMLYFGSLPCCSIYCMLPNKILAFNNCQTYNLPRIIKKSFILWYATVGSHITSPPVSGISDQAKIRQIPHRHTRSSVWETQGSHGDLERRGLSWWKCLEVLHAVGIPKTSEFFSPAASPWFFFWWRFGLFGDLELWKSRIIFFQFFFVVLVKLWNQVGGTKNRGTPKSSILIRFSIINHPFWGTPIFGNPQVKVFFWGLDFYD